MDQHRKDEFVEKSLKNTRDRGIQIVEKLRARAPFLEVLFESPVAINWSARDDRKEKEERQPGPQRELFDDAVVNGQNHVEGAEGDVGNPQVRQRGGRRLQWDSLRQHQRRYRQRDSGPDEESRFSQFEKCKREDRLPDSECKKKPNLAQFQILLGEA